MDMQIERVADSASSFIGGSGPLITSRADDAAILRLWRDKRGEAEPENHSGRHRISQPCNYASARPSANLVHAAHTEFVAALVIHPPRPIPLDADAIDLEDRADHLSQVFSALSAYVAMILDDTAQNVSGRLDLPHVEAVLADLASDVTGTIQHAADGMEGGIA
jgi:hypothetical protein